VCPVSIGLMPGNSNPNRIPPFQCAFVRTGSTGVGALTNNTHSTIMVSIMPAPPTTLGFALLGLLHQAPQSGYDLRKVFAETALGNYSSSPGAIYPALARLERAGLIESRVERAQSLRPKKVYQPTGKGTAALRRWLSQDLAREDAERRLDEVMLRFAFHWLLDAPAQTRRLLGALVDHLDAVVHDLKRQRTLFPPQTPIHPRLAMESGIEQYLASARWARKALEHFKGGTP
jgi:DNA-binding PadR family transcriptional regulator